MPREEQGRATRRRIVEAAAQLFADRGYQAVSIPEVLEATGLSRGALYHHFASKEALFEAVLEATEAWLLGELAAAAAGATDPLEGLRQACSAFLRLASQARVRQIVLTDAPAVVGWARWRQIDERYAFGAMKQAVGAMAAQADLASDLVDPLAHLLLAALMEAALLEAGSSAPTTAVGPAFDLLIARAFRAGGD